MTSKITQVLKYASERGYSVDDEGAVFSKDTKRALRVGSTGYYEFGVKYDGCVYPLPVHKLVAYQKFGDKLFEAGVVVRHLDGNALNNSVGNIVLGSQSDNMYDRPKELRVKHANKAATFTRKINSEQVEEIRKRHKLGELQKDLCSEFGVSKATMSYLINGKTYKGC